MLSIKTELKWTDGITYRGKSERIKVVAGGCERISSDRWQTRSDNVVSAQSKRNEGEGAGFYRWSAPKTKRHFDSRYESFDEWHMSLPLMPLQACQTSIDLTASCSINHPPKVLITVTYKVLTVSYKVLTASYKVMTVTTLIMSSTSQYSRSPS